MHMIILRQYDTLLEVQAKIEMCKFFGLQGQGS
uniref:Uncharacterized protein n=1 Tax=Rhizophora mucronata TaxID=61149 RepID=A0A2P2NF33_RHIMU